MQLNILVTGKKSSCSWIFFFEEMSVRDKISNFHIKYEDTRIQKPFILMPYD